MLKPVLQKNDKRAAWLIIIISAIVFLAVTALANVKLNIDLPFDPHIFATINATLNSIVSVLLVAGLLVVKNGNYEGHKKIMIAAIVLSVLFLVSYICHHLVTDATRFGDADANGVVSESEKAAVGSLRYVYYLLLFTHIPLAGIILPFILFTAYRALTGEYNKHKKLARITWPVWLFVAISGVVIYWMIKPYY